jgi:hypothetical protein
MTGTITFEIDKANDIIIAKPKWNIETKEDCQIWYQQWSDYLTKFGKKIDIVVLLDEFKVASQIAEAWGEYRAKLNNDFFRFSYRVNPELITGIFIKTSGVRYHAASSEANSIESAKIAIKEARKEAGITT